MSINEPGAGSQPLPPTQQPIVPTEPVADVASETRSEAKAPRNTLALIALIVAGVGFLFACIPGALILGWILLPIGFVLAIVSLFLKGRGKGLGVAALIVSIVGTIVGTVVFFSVVSDSLEESFGGTDVIVEGPADSDESAEESPADAPASAEGTRENPVAVGSTISSDDWTAVVNTYTKDGAAAVAEANQFNEPAPAGSHYEIVNYTATYNGAESAYAAEVIVDLVTTSGNVINSYDSLVMLSDSFGLDELFTGASATGSVAFVVPDGESTLVRVQPGILADEVFVTP
jgi:hypothetical protein